MPKNLVKIAIKDYDKLQNQLDKIQKAPRTVLERSMSDARSRVPGWVSAEVTSVYNVKSEEFPPRSRKLGKMKAKGNGIMDLEFAYSGRKLSYSHFDMEPTSPAPSYKLKAKVKRGRKETLGTIKKLTKKQLKNISRNFTHQGKQNSTESPVMLMPTRRKNKRNEEDGKVNYIPFQRQSSDRKDIMPIKVTSIKKMIEDEEVKPNIDAVIEAKLGKRIEHHMKLLEK